MADIAKIFTVAVCIPAYKASALIPETLEFLKKQTYTDWELIVVEDGSNDGTKQIVQDFANVVSQKVVYFKNEHNIGLPATRNVAASLTDKSWVAFLDSDDLWHPTHLADLVNTYRLNPGSDLIHSGVFVFSNNICNVIFEQKLTPEIINQFPVSLFDRRYGIQPSSIMIRKEKYQSIGGSNQNFRYAEDIELWFRCAKNGFTFAFTGKNTCYYRSSGSLTTKTMQMTLDTANVYENNIDWRVIPKVKRIQCVSDAWYHAAKMVRASNKQLAAQYLSSSLKHRFALKYLLYWIFIKIA